ncbi:uncharacterized protein MONOS_15366 [Monocercomonoides exilis]|uniref:uncharacterized protein n=1 Tax=Monocercomonoides exilis TaxID=2049356 RepID=UPI003559B3B1|nr:hypothetical protein MONOS_15366 [Monocercomonoides exilis]|eukprot:MONOS_15366.1-p1 / transcript=MONOS_15366.1 / gene=MONOS_15366 / organism=Monocercomonoides_exilis_PA203 / gene_product=unspecified product / transcript_product=unspecified product / location=Mono_scaffold01210:2578-3658(+) / protein_length=213 / sequence_SO=supercontig / SO=protein_coding / is_pseudo=false
MIEQVKPQRFSSNIGMLSRAIGSVRYQQGESEVIVSVNGPSLAPPKKHLYDRAFIELFIFEKDERVDTYFDARPSVGYKVAEKRILSLIDAGIPLLFTPCASTVSVIPTKKRSREGTLVEALAIWPTKKDEKNAMMTANMTFANSNMEAVGMMWMEGVEVGSEEKLTSIINLARRGAKQVLQFIRTAVGHKFNVSESSLQSSSSSIDSTDVDT